MQMSESSRIMVAGHRGWPDKYPENTMKSFLEAMQAGVDMLETDIHLTQDGIAVLMHDHTLDRTTNGKGYVCAHTFTQIKELNSAIYDIQETIPTLEELLSAVSSTKGMLVNLELKDYLKLNGSAFMQQSVNTVVELVERYGMRERCILNSFDAAILEYIHLKYGNQYPLHGFYPYTYLDNKKLNPEEYLFCACVFDNTPCPRKEYFDFLLERNIQVWLASNLREEEDFCRAAEYGCQLITTNSPADTLKTLRKLGLHE